ncbi:MAG TPA: AbrB/MazE/SpoVT family DNA-binding domain-containing protein [Candidatus Nanoarchaeia archaeon]|nr:AbrB/MazE/SpoVT family DNA-binding domain-containing protein [Candidatus Nanoarchaeia archaeon]
MKRKVMKIGPASLVMSLPSGWAKRYSIQKGDEIEVEERGRNLQITTKKEILTKDKAEINISKFCPMIMRALGILYKVGYKKININYSKENSECRKMFSGQGLKEIDLIKRAADSYTGMDIEKFNQKLNEVTLIERANVLYEEFDNTLNHAFLHLTQISEQVKEALFQSDKTLEKEIDLTDNLINQTTNFCQKILNKQGYQEFNKTHFVYHIVTGIEDLGDRYHMLYEDYSKKKTKKLTSEIILILKNLDIMLNEFYAIFRKFDVKKLTELAYTYHEILFDIEKASKKISRDEILMLSCLVDIANRIYDLLEPLMALNNEKMLDLK